MPERKRILFLDHSLELGGAELSLLDILTPPPNLTVPFAITAVAFGEGPFLRELQKAQVPTLVLRPPPHFLSIKREGGLWRSLRGVLTSISLARQLIRQAPPFAVLHCNTQKAFVVGCLAKLISRKPLIWHLRDILTPEHFSRIQIKLVICLSRFCGAKVIANSQATADAYLAAGGRADRVQVIYNGISPPGPEIQGVLLPHISSLLSQNLVFFGVFGRISPWKGQDLAIQALAKIPDAHLLIVGAPLFGEEEYEKKLRALVKELGLEKRVHFLGFQRHVWPIMRACHFILHTSTEPEPFGRVIVEGMLCQKVVLAPDIGGPREILEHLKTGVLYRARSAEDLVDQLYHLVKNPELAEKIARDAKTSAQRRFSRERMVKQVYQALESEC